MKNFFKKVFGLISQFPEWFKSFCVIMFCLVGMVLFVVLIVSCESVNTDTYNKSVDNKHIYYQHNSISSDSDYSGNVENNSETYK